MKNISDQPLYYPELSAVAIANILEDRLECNMPLENSYLEDAITHLRILTQEIENLKRIEENKKVCSICGFNHGKYGTCWDS